MITKHRDCSHCLDEFLETQSLTSRDGCLMTNDERDIVQVLERELSLLENGWYDHSPAYPWRAPLVFEDSPTCPSFNATSLTHICGACVLKQLVPLMRQSEKVPCRHIPLNDEGETVDILYRCGTTQDMKVLLRNWLLKTIARLKENRRRLGSDDQHPSLALHDCR